MPTPAFPADGVIESYDPFDALGWIRLVDGGTRVRFGRSACSFDPVVENRVRVVDAKPGPLGHLRAASVEPLGERAPTFSERVILMRRVLLMPVDSYSDWALACHLRDVRAEDAAAYAAIREELLARRVSPPAIDEMVSLARWAEEILSPRHGMVACAIGDESDVAWAIDVAAERGIVSADDAERLRVQMKALGSSTSRG